MCATAAPAVAVIDGDLQHDEPLLPKMLDALQAELASSMSEALRPASARAFLHGSMVR